MCTLLPDPDNGRIIYSTGTTSPYEFGTVAIYMCDTGFGIDSGDVLRTCRGDRLSPMGIWTGIAPRCERTFCYNI